MSKQFDLTLSVTVDDEEQLFDHAMQVATECADGPKMTRETAKDLLRPQGFIDVGACVQMVLDPGFSPPGLSIDESSIEELCIYEVDLGDEDHKDRGED